MRKLVVDRTEGIYTVCVDKDGKYFAIETSEMPEGADKGTAIVISDEGEISVDAGETARLKAKKAGK